MKVVGWTIVVLLGAVLIAGLQSPRRIGVGCRRIVSSAFHSFSFTRRSDKDDYEKSFLANVPAKKTKGAVQKKAFHEDFEDVFEDLDSVDDSDEDSGIEILKGNVRSPKEMNDKEWMFFDVARIHVKGGDGGDGCMAMRREYCVEYGGPSGGNGGHGGHVFLECNHNLNTLAGLRHKIHHKAHDGTNGRGDSRHGYKGEDTVIYVPPGSIVRDQSGALAGELNNHGDRMMVARGGKGGRGNEYFKTPRHNAPLFAEKGEVGCERWIGIELKLIADVGLVGVPNAGKSTLLAAVTNAKPKIADYPFTTVVPNLGICDLFPVESPPKTSSAISSFSTTASGSMVLADIPGLLEGAHLGIGLGIAFLRHIQRCKVLIHVLRGDSPDPLGDFQAINQELLLFNPQLANKTQVIVVNKLDLPEVAAKFSNLRYQLQQEAGHTRILGISALTRHNVRELMVRVHKLLQTQPIQLPMELFFSDDSEERINFAEEDDFVIPLESKKNRKSSLSGGKFASFSGGNGNREGKVSAAAFEILVDAGVQPREFRLVGKQIERWMAMLNWNYYGAMERFQRLLEAHGVNEELKKAGAVQGDVVRIGDRVFDYWDAKHQWMAKLGHEGDMSATSGLRAA